MTWYIAVIGPGEATETEIHLAYEAGAAIAESKSVLLTGGLGGVMEAACKGCAEQGGISIAILPGEHRGDANRFATFAIPTAMGQARNLIVANGADAVVSIGGGWGTLSEIGFVARAGKPIVLASSWSPQLVAGNDLLPKAESGRKAVAEALRMLEQNERRSGEDPR